MVPYKLPLFSLDSPLISLKLSGGTLKVPLLLLRQL